MASKSVIIDCGSECTIIRVPHEEAVKMILYTQDKELIDKLKIASSRSKKVRDILDDLQKCESPRF